MLYWNIRGWMNWWGDVPRIVGVTESPQSLVAGSDNDGEDEGRNAAGGGGASYTRQFLGCNRQRIFVCSSLFRWRQHLRRIRAARRRVQCVTPRGMLTVAVQRGILLSDHIRQHVKTNCLQSVSCCIRSRNVTYRIGALYCGPRLTSIPYGESSNVRIPPTYDSALSSGRAEAGVSPASSPAVIREIVSPNDAEITTW